MLKNKKRVIFALLSLLILTMGSFTLAKYTQKNVYLLRMQYIDDSDDPDDPKWYIGESIELDTNVTQASDLPKALKKNGYYAIQVWGGAGGDSGVESSMNKGGSGGYVMGYIKYDSTKPLSIYVGQGGKQGSAGGSSVSTPPNKYWGGNGGNEDSGIHPEYYGYGGGGASVVEYGNNVVLVAGGGGGAGNNYPDNPNKASGGDAGSSKGKEIWQLEPDPPAPSDSVLPGSNGEGTTVGGDDAGGAGGAWNQYKSQDATNKGGGGGGGYYAGASGIEFNHYGDLWSSSGGGGGASYSAGKTEEVFYPISTVSKLYLDGTIGLVTKDKAFEKTHSRNGKVIITFLGSGTGSHDKTALITEMRTHVPTN